MICNSEIEKLLAELIVSQSYFPQDDLLCNIHLEKVVNVDELSELTRNKIQEILRESKKNYKETGVNITCLSRGILRKKNKNKNTNNIPVFLYEIDLHSNLYEYTILDEHKPILNPYIKRILEIDTIENYSNLEELRTNLKSVDYELFEKPEFIGNFHPFRYEILKDIIEIHQSKNYSQNLKQLLFDEVTNEAEKEIIQNKFLSVPDKFQLNALKNINQNSFVLQGPPGTGKTQTISMIIERCLWNNQTVLVCSEKKAAIDSLYQKLKKNKLHFCCLLNHSSFDKKLIIQDLKKTWEHYQLYNEKLKVEIEPYYSFANIINQLTSIPLPDGINLQSISSFHNYSSVKLDVSKISSHEFQSFIQLCERHEHIVFSIINKLQLKNRKWSLIELELQSKNALSIIEKLHEIQPVKSVDDIHEIVRLFLLTQKFSSDLYQRWMPFAIKYAKKISVYRNEIIKQTSILNKLEKEIGHWIILPTETELNHLENQTIKKGFLSAYKQNKVWKKWTRTPQLNMELELGKMAQYQAAKQKLENAFLKIRLIGLNDLNELELISQITNNTKKSEWDKYQKLDKQLIIKLNESSSEIAQLKNIISTHFNLGAKDDIPDFLYSLEKDKKGVFEILSKLSSCSEPILNLLSASSSLDELKGNYYVNIWNSAFNYSPIPLEQIRNLWIEEARNNEKNKLLECESNASRLRLKIASKFRFYEELILKPNSKLTQQEKELKERLKKGKSILVKEFAKKRSYKSLRELYNSDAKEWLMILKPILIAHPQRLGNYFSPQKNLFDLGIIDEASQMPLSHAIGTLQRTKRIVIAGDFQQMPPKLFFKQSNIDEPSILHQAKFNLPNIQLLRHYRSENKELIAFSNKHFYNDSLEVIENAKSIGLKSVHHHFIPEGIYDDRINEIEARKVASFIDSQISKISSRETFGIVAFSELQLECIKKHISPENYSIIEEKMEQDYVFFKALEQVQGDECDHLIISFGYAKNKEGKFEMRFGPVNQNEGEKRLNVLFSRARKQISFFSSVTIDDFPTSKNEGVNMLKNWFKFLHDFEELPKSGNSTISVFDIIKQSADADDFSHLVWLYHQRGWKILPS